MFRCGSHHTSSYAVDGLGPAVAVHLAFAAGTLFAFSLHYEAVSASPSSRWRLVPCMAVLHPVTLAVLSLHDPESPFLASVFAHLARYPALWPLPRVFSDGCHLYCALVVGEGTNTATGRLHVDVYGVDADSTQLELLRTVLPSVGAAVGACPPWLAPHPGGAALVAPALPTTFVGVTNTILATPIQYAIPLLSHLPPLCRSRLRCVECILMHIVFVCFPPLPLQVLRHAVSVVHPRGG